ncbi:hypothetical protein FMUND_403 [Fusarium mundagurra]|uniref:Secreted protein CSS2 C-terminal domain-containing protein n=1 Tax=Fusarium mundagurra TaxID=1567541 RepID=A0A8H5Z8M3_9HYPO|nr:hypothetical protein FMUND_403 [Fusarium mundagurra]
MKPALMSFFVLMSLPLSVYSMPSTEVTAAVKMPDLVALYHLEDFESEDSALEKRRNVRVCERILAVTSQCIVIGNALKDGIIQISSAIKHASNVQTCTTFTGRAGPGGNLFYRYHETCQSNGRHCDTTAEQETIAGAIERHIKRHGHKICGTECLNLTHGGTWNGYLLIGPADKFDHNVECGPEISFQHCDSGGKGDLN